MTRVPFGLYFLVFGLLLGTAGLVRASGNGHECEGEYEQDYDPLTDSWVYVVGSFHCVGTCAAPPDCKGEWIAWTPDDGGHWQHKICGCGSAGGATTFDWAVYNVLLLCDARGDYGLVGGMITDYASTCIGSCNPSGICDPKMVGSTYVQKLVNGVYIWVLRRTMTCKC